MHDTIVVSREQVCMTVYLGKPGILRTAGRYLGHNVSYWQAKRKLRDDEQLYALINRGDVGKGPSLIAPCVDSGAEYATFWLGFHLYKVYETFELYALRR